MGFTKGDRENYEEQDNARSWAVGTVITGILPYLAMLSGWIADACSNPFLAYYTGIADSVAFVYSVSLCLLLLCLDFDKKIEKKIRSRWKFISFLATIISAMAYCARTHTDVAKK